MGCRIDRTISHRPYYVLPTAAVNRYVAADVNRWILLGEVLMEQAEPKVPLVEPVSPDEQMINGVLLSAVMRTFQLIFGGVTPHSISALWRDTWDGTKSRGRSASNKRVKKLGLNYAKCVDKFGCAWLPDNLMVWSHPPRFTPNALNQLSLANNAFQRSFMRTPRIQERLSREQMSDQLFIEHLRRYRDHVADSPEQQQAFQAAFNLGASLIVQAYIVDLFHLLATRIPSDIPESRINQPARLRDFLSPLTVEERLGLRGLHHRMIETLLSRAPTVLKPKMPRTSSFAEYNTGLWVDKVFAVFAFDDNHDPIDPTTKPRTVDRRRWNNLPFRQLTRKLTLMVASELGTAGKDQFTQSLKQYAPTKLWIIARNDAGKFAALQKGLRSRLSQLERTGWLMPEVNVHVTLWHRYEYAIGASNRGPNELDMMFDSIPEPFPCTETFREVIDEVEDAWTTTPWITSRQSDVDNMATPRNPDDFGVTLTLTEAEAFQAELHARCGRAA